MPNNNNQIVKQTKLRTAGKLLESRRSLATNVVTTLQKQSAQSVTILYQTMATMVEKHHSDTTLWHTTRLLKSVMKM